MAGVTTLGVNDADSIATIHRSLELGVNHLDTAYGYGRQGESDQLIRRALVGRRDEVVLATKCGLHFEGDEMVADGRPATLQAECEESLERLGTERVDLLYLHLPDEKVPMEDSAGALRELMEQGKTRAVGVCNASLERLQKFQSVCPITAVQLPYNMLQREIENRIVPWCQQEGIAIAVYWILIKGLLAGRLSRNQALPEGDSRREYPMYQGDQWEKNQDFVDRLREIATEAGCTVAQLVVRWTIEQPGITVALCGAKRAWQIEETAADMSVQLTPSQRAAIDEAIATRGPAAGKKMIF